MKTQIFISYRRDTGRHIARNIADRLISKDYNVFFDYTSMRNGEFNRQIYKAIESADDFILVLSKGAMDRCVNIDDWVRCEILHALKYKRNIVLVQDENFIEFPKTFPSELSVITQIDFTPINDKYYDAFINTLTERLVSSTVTLKIKSDADCVIYVNDNKIKYASRDEITDIKLNKGKYTLKVVSTISGTVEFRKLINTADINTNDILLITLKEQILLSTPDDDIIIFRDKTIKRYGLKCYGKNIIEPIYDYISSCKDGLLKVHLNEKYGYINKCGQVVVPIIYDTVHEYQEGLAEVRLNYKSGFVNKKGKVVIPIEYDYVGNFQEGFAAVGLNNKEGFIDNKGEIVIPLIYDSTGARSSLIEKDKWGFNYGYAPIKLNNKYGYINSFGEVIIDLLYDDLKCFNKLQLSTVKLRGKWGLLDNTGAQITKFIYDDIGYFRDGLALVELKGKHGVINKYGKEIAPLVYDNIFHFQEGLACVQRDGKYGFINECGKEVIPLKYLTTAGTGFNNEILVVIDINRYPIKIDRYGNEYAIDYPNEEILKIKAHRNTESYDKNIYSEIENQSKPPKYFDTNSSWLSKILNWVTSMLRNNQ